MGGTDEGEGSAAVVAVARLARHRIGGGAAHDLSLVLVVVIALLPVECVSHGDTLYSEDPELDTTTRPGHRGCWHRTSEEERRLGRGDAEGTTRKLGVVNRRIASL
jgi:hypothetical protein